MKALLNIFGNSFKSKQKTLFIHIGLHKTGTSSIQLFLHKNRESILLQDKIYYLPVPQDDIAPMQHRFLNNLMVQNEAAFQDYFSKHITNANKFIVSSECFIEKEIYCEKLKDLKKIFDKIYILVSLRRQDYWLESLYRFRVINKFEKRFSFSFDEWIEMMKNGKYQWYNPNYLQTLDYWSELFGINNIKILPYQDEVKKFNIVDDFNKIVGITSSSNLPTEIFVNQSITNREYIEFLRITNNTLKPEQQKELKAYLCINEYEKISFISPVKREEVIGHFENINHNISTKYNNGIPLFSSEIKKNQGWFPFIGISKSNKIIISDFIVNNSSH